MSTVTTLLGKLPDRSGMIDDGYKRTYEENYLVATKDLHDAAYAVVNCPDLPKMWDKYAPNSPTEVDRPIWVNKKSAKPHGTEDPNLWAVTVEYSSDVKDPELQADSPLDRPARLKYSFERSRKSVEREPLQIDGSGGGRAIINSAYDTFEGVEIDAVHGVIEVTKNLPFFDYKFLKDFMNAVNSDVFLALPVATVKCHDISCNDREFENGTVYYPTRFVFHHEDDGWDLSLLDSGFREYREDLTDWRDIVDSRGHKVSQPALLNGAGRKLAFGAAPVYLTFRLNIRRPFVLLGLP